MHNSSVSYKCTCTFTCQEAEFKRERQAVKQKQTLFHSLSQPFHVSVSLSLYGVPAGSYNPALEKRGPVKQHKRIGAQIPLD